MKNQNYRVGTVAMIGRPNVGKSTLLNALVQQKVAIVSNKPQTTRSKIAAVHEDERGQIFFLDSPGYYEGRGKSSSYNALVKDAAKEADVILLVVDKSRKWGQEDERVWNMVYDMDKPKIMVINKSDIPEPDYGKRYEAMAEMVEMPVLYVSASMQKHVKGLVNLIYEHLPEGKRDPIVDQFETPLMYQTSYEYIAELIREKVYIYTKQEVPYVVQVHVRDIEHDDEHNKMTIRAELSVPDKRYKPILIGKEGKKINQIKESAKKELALLSNKEVRMSLTVLVR